MTTRTLAFQVPRELARTEAMTTVQAPDRHTPLRSVAQRLTRRGVAGAKVELVNTALLAFVEVIFDADPDGVYANLDKDGRVLIPAPWGRSGGRLWGLRNTEQRAFSWLMRQRSDAESAPLFVFDAECKQWLLASGYTKITALAYLRQMPITLGEWRAAWSATRSTWASQNLGEA